MAIRLKALDYKFQNLKLLQDALTHPSALTPGQGMAFERLEFLGDRVLGLVVASWLFEAFPKDTEGALSKRLTGLVCKEILVKVAHSLGLEDAMKIKQEKSFSQQKRLETVLADGCEALIGALYLDGGLTVASDFIHTHWSSYLTLSPMPPCDPKSSLQEWVQGRGHPAPLYRVLQREGPPHAPIFTVEVTIEGYEPARGMGSSKQSAEKRAAENLLGKIKLNEDQGSL